MDQKKSISIPEALANLQKICSTREKCPADIIVLLKRWGIGEQHHSEIIDRLKQDKFIDEYRFTTAFVRDKIHFDHWGIIKINYFLTHKGIPKKIRDEAIKTIDVHDYVQMIRKEMTKKRKILKGDPREIWAKLARYGSSRGYEMEYMHDFLNEIEPGD